MRSWSSSARVRARRGIISPRPGPASLLSSPIAARPVRVARIGKNRLPPGLVVYVRPLSDVDLLPHTY